MHSFLRPFEGFFVRKFLKSWIACAVLKRRYQTAVANPCKILNVDQILFTAADSIKISIYCSQVPYISCRVWFGVRRFYQSISRLIASRIVYLLQQTQHCSSTYLFLIQTIFGWISFEHPLEILY